MYSKHETHLKLCLYFLFCLVLLGSLCLGFSGQAICDDGDQNSQDSQISAAGSEGKIVVESEDDLPPVTDTEAVVLPQMSATTSGFVNDTNAGTVNYLSNVPAFRESYGSAPTVAAMIMGYYDRSGFPNMYTGPTNGGVCPMDNSCWGQTVYAGGTCYECPLSATHAGVDGRTTRGHVDDYWRDFNNEDPDPYIGNWTQHAYGDCVGDYMGASQSNWTNYDGHAKWVYFADGSVTSDYTGLEPQGTLDYCHGLKLFVVSRGYKVTSNFNQLLLGRGTNPTKGFTYANYKAEIDAGRPVLLHTGSYALLGLGYNTTGSLIYYRHSADFSDHQMSWDGYYAGKQLKAVTVIRLSGTVVKAPLSPKPTAPADNATVHGCNVTFKWAASSGATQYFLDVSRKSDGATVYSQNVGKVTSKVLTGFPDDGTVYNWRVSAGNANGWSAYTNAISFTDGAIPAVPKQASPANNVKVMGNSVTFKWTKSKWATKYMLKVKNASGVVLSSTETGDVTSLAVGSFPNNGTQYKWCVAAGNNAGWSADTADRTFTNGNPTPAVPALSAPADNALVKSTSITFRWTAPYGATKYRLRVVRVSDSTVFYNQELGKVTSKAVTGFPNDGTVYKWSVSAGNDAGWSAFSSERTVNNGQP